MVFYRIIPRPPCWTSLGTLWWRSPSSRKVFQTFENSEDCTVSTLQIMHFEMIFIDKLSQSKQIFLLGYASKQKAATICASPFIIYHLQTRLCNQFWKQVKSSFLWVSKEFHEIESNDLNQTTWYYQVDSDRWYLVESPGSFGKQVPFRI